MSTVIKRNGCIYSDMCRINSYVGCQWSRLYRVSGVINLNIPLTQITLEIMKNNEIYFKFRSQYLQ